MVQYLNLLKKVLKEGSQKIDRTKTGTISLFGTQTRFDLSKGFPLLTTKKMHFKSIVYELLWFIRGDTNIKYLVDNGVRIWNEWPYVQYQKSPNYQGETMDEFIDKIKNSKAFANKYGDLGPVYGKQWRDFRGIDQLSKAIATIKNNPNSRRIIISAWNPPEIDTMLLPPCHAFIQFYVNNNRLSTLLYQRSADVFLGVPFNIASYALLTHLVASISGLEVGEFVHSTGDTHIYLNHISQVKKQIARSPRSLPKLKLNKDITEITNFKYEDIELIDYDHHPPIKGRVSV